MNPEIHLQTAEMSVEDEVELIVSYLIDNKIIRTDFLTRADDAA